MSTVLKDDFATQAGHWYSPDGSPRYTIIGKNGKERNTTVRDARERGLLPSVTTILRQAAAPGLEKWKIGNAIMSALTLARQEGESDEDYINRIVRDSNEQAAKARDKGTEIHGAIEKLDRHGPYSLHVDAAMGAVGGWAGLMDWDAERSFASPLGFGGKLDLSAPGFVCDFKTTDKDLAGLKLWPDHRRQLAAYRHGLDMPEARCSICYVSSTKPEARVIELDEAELKQGWTEFRALLAFYYAANKLELP
ncbi:hypothetical protein M0Q28_07060 [Patescibacteria group bacterium]|jgi:hypothetical protein|nr:hypothetical protein [Patescibacteria group bacterium]